MLTAEIKVNGVLIGHVYIHNEGYVNDNLDDDDDMCNYSYHAYDVGEGEIIGRGTVKHPRKDGAFRLVERVLFALR